MPYVEKIFTISELCDGPQLVAYENEEYATALGRCWGAKQGLLDRGCRICGHEVQNQLRNMAALICGPVLLRDLGNIFKDSQLASVLFLHPQKIAIPRFKFFLHPFQSPWCAAGISHSAMASPYHMPRRTNSRDWELDNDTN